MHLFDYRLRKSMIVFIWIYALIGTGYFVIYEAGIDIIVKYAVGPMWLAMVFAPVTLAGLIFLPFLVRFLPSENLSRKNNLGNLKHKNS